MNPTRSTNSRRNEESRSILNESHNTQLKIRSRTEEEKQRRREEWKYEQEMRRQHERLKKKKIEEYERDRALKQTLKIKGTSLHHRRSKSSSKSPTSYHWHRRRSLSSVSKPDTLFERLDESTSGAVPLFKGPEGTQISATELRRIKVDIRRNIPVKEPITELQRDILNPEDVVLKRREGEGDKPIFERDEIKRAISGIEVEERRTVVAIHGEQPVSIKSRTSKKNSPLSIKNRSCSPESPSYQPRYHMDSKRYDSRIEYRKDDGRNSVERHREYKEKYTDRNTKKHYSNHSRSRERERDSRNSHSRSFISERSYRDRYRDRSSERSHERRDRDRSRERRNTAPHYIEQVPVPIYYGNFPPRPIVVSPMVPIRGQVPPIGRGRHPTLMAPVRPFPPRFVPPDIYRMGPPNPNPRYGPIF